jgi:hypothetical protein
VGALRKGLTMHQPTHKSAALIDALLDAAFRSLQHDSGPDEHEYQHLRRYLKEDFKRILANKRTYTPQAEEADLLKQNEELKKDAERLDVLEAALKTGKRLSYYKKNFSLIGLTNYEYEVFRTVREAIDAFKEQTK